MIRELVGSLTQARVQMVAAIALLEEKIGQLSMKMTTAQTAEKAAEIKREYDALVLDKQKLSRSMAVVGDVREDILEMEKPRDEKGTESGKQ